MPAILKTTLLQSLQTTVESHLHLAITRYQNLDEARLLRPAPGGGWSISQCLWHLNSYGDFYLPLLQQAVLKKKKQSLYFSSGWLGNYFTNAMNPETGTKKMKAFKGHIPPEQQDAHATVAEFIRQQELLLQCLRAAADAKLDQRLPISLSKLIRLKAGDVFRFLVAHNERHIQQAEKVLK